MIKHEHMKIKHEHMKIKPSIWTRAEETCSLILNEDACRVHIYY